MAKKTTEKDVLIVRDEKTGEISVVAGLNADGSPKRTPAKAENAQSFLQFDRHGDVLDNGKSLMLALSQDLSQNRPAEAREHVRRFHELFFTLSPEKSAIEHNVKRALLLADKSVYNYYSDFAEKGYYNRIIAGNINQVLKVDSVVCDFNGYPYCAVTYATQKIIRQSNVTERSLVTTCRLLNSSRSDNNPNGFTIEGFTIIENKDLQTIKR